MNKYYKLDSRKVTYGEYWNILRSWKVIIPWTAKLLHVRMNFGTPLACFESVRELEIPEEEFSARAREKLQGVLDQCLAEGFQAPRFFTHGSLRGDVRTWFMALLHPSGATVRLMYTVATKVQPPKERVLVVLLSEWRDGTFFFTSNQRQQFLSAPRVVANRLLGAAPAALLASHMRKLRDLPINNPPLPVTSGEMLDDLWDRYERYSREFGMQRGIYVWLTPEETAREEGGLVAAQTMAGAGGENLDVMLEIQRLRSQRTSATGLIAIFVISLLLFMLAGSRQWSWDYLVILLGVLFVHELGHYVAMRAFHYQNVRMFFIPFFGAAVTGRHYNVAGWKQVVVSLMGPLPGIGLGIIVGVAGIVIHQPILVKVAVVSLLLNGSNLLPVLPLDGGRVIQNLICSRHYVMDLLFRVVAALLLIASAAWLSTRVLPVLGIFMLLGLPLAFRTARIAADLKARALPPVAEDTRDIPPETAQVIIGEIKKTAPGPQSTKMVAQQTLQIFEMLNARPPGWAATLGLLFVHFAGLAAAIVFGLGFIVVQRGDLPGLAGGASMASHRLAATSMAAWNETMPLADGIVLVATTTREREATALFMATTNVLPPAASLRQFGESVLLGLPAGRDDLRRAWLAEFRKRTKDVFVDRTNFHAAFSLSCVAKNSAAAERIVNELNGYFQTLPGESLIPPWDPRDALPAAEREAENLARQTYVKLQAVQFGTQTNVALAELQRKLAAAQEQGDAVEIREREQQLVALAATLNQQSLERIRKGEEGAVADGIFELFTNLSAPATMTNRAASEVLRRDLAKRMGQYTPEAGANATRYGARSGLATFKRSFVNVTFVSFDSLLDGPPALAGWLRQQSCVAFRYGFQPGMADEGDSGD